MKILMIAKYPPIQGGVSRTIYWLAQNFIENGHQVEVVTNACEVEDVYKISLSVQDQALLHGYRIPNAIKIHSTYIDEQHRFIPQNNPSVSKLVGVGLKVVQDFQPDLIWASYIEPYGVAALLLAQLTKIPFLIQHAGSDIGRLMRTEQLNELYIQVFKRANFVLTHSGMRTFFKDFGLDEKQLFYQSTALLPEYLFYPPPFEIGPEIFTIGIYGKTGRCKGTLEILEAMRILKLEKFACRLHAHWDHTEIWMEKVRELQIADCVSIQKFIPHWKIPAFIWGCDMIAFLENQFPIAIHTPSIPFETLCCGRPLLTTSEIEAKNPTLLKKGENCMILQSHKLSPYAIAEGIKTLYHAKQRGDFIDTFWCNCSSVANFNNERIRSLLNAVAKQCCEAKIHKL